MKKIVCELCEGSEFVKEGGMFVCQGCGTKYSLEEAKSMMKEVEGAAPVAAPAAAAPAESAYAPAPAPAVNPNQQLENILILATNAYEADNKKEAENYCNRAIELDATCYKAWFLKGRAVGWQSKIDDLRIEEAAHSFCHAIDYAPEEEKEGLKDDAVEELKNLGLALISLRKQRFSGSPDAEELKGFTTARKVLLDSLTVLLCHGNIVGIPDGYLESIATMMNEASVAALNMARKAWDGVDHPSDKDLTTFIEWCSNISSLLRQAINVTDDDDEADIVRYRNLAISLEEPIGKNSEERYWDSYRTEYRWKNSKCLTDEAVASRKKEAAECREKADALEKRIKAEKERKAEEERLAAEEAKRQRVEAYWAAHSEEKAQLDAEKAQLEAKKSELEPQLAELNGQISAIEAEYSGVKVNAEIEVDRLQNQLASLNARKAALGLFAGKEKKQISEEIAGLEARISGMGVYVQQERSTLYNQVQAKAAPFKEKLEALNVEWAALASRLTAVEEELTKDRDEE